MIIEIVVLDKKTQKFRREIVKKARRLTKLLSAKGVIEVYLIGDKRIQRLNGRFRGKNKPTNVLSFTKPKGFPGKELGEVYLAPLYIEKHREDLGLMLVHGVLHILGYGHKRKSDRIKMQRKESKLLSKLKI